MFNLEINAAANSAYSNAIAQILAVISPEHSSLPRSISSLENSAWLNFLSPHSSHEAKHQLSNYLRPQDPGEPASPKFNLEFSYNDVIALKDRLNEASNLLDFSLQTIQTEGSKHTHLPEYLNSGINTWMNSKILVEGLPKAELGKETNKIKFIDKNFYEGTASIATKNTALDSSQSSSKSQAITSELSPSLEAAKDKIIASVKWDAIEGESSDLGFGLNAYQGFRGENVKDQTYQKNMSFMSPGIIRFHNAGMMNDSSTTDGLLKYGSRTWDEKKIVNGLMSSYESFGNNQPERMINIPTWPAWMDINKDGLLDSNQYDNYAKLCADLVKIINKNHNFNVKYWEITNEKDESYFTPFHSNGGWGALKEVSNPNRLNDLITIYNKTAIAMKKVDPTIQVGGPGFARSDLQPFYIPFIKGTVKNLDFLSYHYYATGSTKTSDQDVYEATNAIGNRTATMVEALKEISPGREIPVILGEYNISWTWNSRDPRMTNHKGVVFDALSVVRALKNGAGATLAWNEKDGVYGKTDNEDKMRLSGSFLHLMNQHLVGDRVSTKTSNEKAITTYAVTNPELHEKSYLIINHSSSKQTIQLDFGDWSPKQQNFYKHEISAPGYSTKTVSWSSLGSSITVPVDSVTLLTFTD